jgi:SAM-dependent methyltransferase
VNGAEPDHWSAIAAGWELLWGRLGEPVWTVLADSLGIGPGTRVLDVGCGPGDLLVHLARLGAAPAGIDPAPGMVARSRDRLPGADIRLGSADHLPWPDRRFDVVTAVNAVQFADDTDAALAELVRVTVPGGHVAVSNWAEAGRNDLDTIEEAVARAVGDEPLPDGDLRHPGGLEELLRDAGLTVVGSGLVETPWSVPDDDTLVRGVLLGEDPDTLAARSSTVVTAARPFRTPTGGYRLVNAFRYAVGRRSG